MGFSGLHHLSQNPQCLNGISHSNGIGQLEDRPRFNLRYHLFHVIQQFDYINNVTLETGGSSVSASLLSDFSVSDAWSIKTAVQPNAVILWGIDSEFADFTLRNYDFGSGAGIRLRAGVDHNNRQIARAFYYFIWMHTLDGAPGDHLLHYLGVRATVPVWKSLGIGGEYLLSVRDSRFRDFPDVFRRNPQFRLFGALYLD